MTALLAFLFGTEVLTEIKTFVLGMKEFRSQYTTNPGPMLIERYDQGRDFAHAITLRRYDQAQ